MRCRRCKQKAIIHLPSHRLALCKVCYPPWLIRQVERTIKKFHMVHPGEKILVAVSGGKDSLALWDILHRLGYETAGLHIQLGIAQDDYSEKSLAFCQALAEKIQRPLFVERVQSWLGETMDGVKKRSRRPACSACGLVKRYLMNRVAREQGYGVVATAHNLDDEVATLFSNNLRWDLAYFGRQYPVLDAREGFVKKIKPMVFISEKENAMYALIQGIGYIRQECPYAKGATSIPMKELFNRLEHRSPGLKRNYLVHFYHHHGTFTTLFREQESQALTSCERCGQPTTRKVCAFCTLQESMKPKEISCTSSL